MEEKFIRGGCVINWKIENCNFYKNPYFSPRFYLESCKETEWYLLISYQNCSFTCYLEPINLLLETCVSFDIFISSNEESVEKSGIKFFPTKWNFHLAYLSTREIMPFGNLLIQVHLRNMSDLSFSQHHFCLRTVEEVETREVDYDVPLYHVLFENRTLSFRVLPVCQKSIPFKIKLWGSNGKDDVKFLNIDIIECSKNEHFGLYCKILTEDQEGRLIISKIKTFSFGGEIESEEEEDQDSGEDLENEEDSEVSYDEVEFEEEELVEDKETLEESKCSLKIPFTEETLNSLSSSINKIKLKCLFCTTYGKRTSWIENSSIVPVHKANCEEIRSENSESITLTNDFLHFYNEGKYSDIILSAHGRHFPTHKVILRARSQVFSDLFDGDSIEKGSNLVEIIDIEAETLSQMIFYMYSDTLQTEEYGDILKLYEAADKYKVKTLKDRCSKVLKKKLNVHNSNELLILAHVYNDIELQKSIEAFIFARGKEVFQTEEWKILMKDEPSLGCKILHNFCTANL